MCPENRRLVKGGDKKTAELVLEQPSEGRDPGRSGRILTVTGEAICGRLSDRIPADENCLRQIHKVHVQA